MILQSAHNGGGRQPVAILAQAQSHGRLHPPSAHCFGPAMWAGSSGGCAGASGGSRAGPCRPRGARRAAHLQGVRNGTEGHPGLPPGPALRNSNSADRAADRSRFPGLRTGLGMLDVASSSAPQCKRKTCALQALLPDVRSRSRRALGGAGGASRSPWRSASSCSCTSFGQHGPTTAQEPPGQVV